MTEPLAHSPLTKNLVHAPLEHWARTRGDALALSDGVTHLSFAALHTAVTQQAQALTQTQAPATVWVDSALPTLAQLVAFLAIITSGRCAAVSDPDWPEAVRLRVMAACEAQAACDAQALTRLGESTQTSAKTKAQQLFYIGFTSGSSGLPKGFARSHASWVESFQICLDTFGPGAAACVLAPGRMSHSLFLFAMLLGVYSGGGVVVQARFSAARMIATLQQGLTPCVVAVPSQLLMLLDLAKRRGTPALGHVRLILISGARWMRERSAELQALCPNARIVEFYGASETSFMAWMDATQASQAQEKSHLPVPLSAQAVGRPFANVEIDIRNPDAQGVGQIFVRSPMLFDGYVGVPPDHTAAVRDGEWLSVRDMGYLDAQGLLCLAGRENRMLVTQGKNLFPEEVEAVLCAHSSVARAAVLGLADPVRGQFVVAVVQWHGADTDTDTDTDTAADADADTGAGVQVSRSAHTERLGALGGDATHTSMCATSLSAHCRSQLEAYKVPKQFWHCDAWPQTASGKTDVPVLERWLKRALECALMPNGAKVAPARAGKDTFVTPALSQTPSQTPSQQSSLEALPCLQRLS